MVLERSAFVIRILRLGAFVGYDRFRPGRCELERVGPPLIPGRAATCAANTLTAKEVWSCKRDEGRPLGAGDQAQLQTTASCWRWW